MKNDQFDTLFSQLQKRRKFWQHTNEDPRQIAAAVYVALAEVESAVRATMRKHQKSKPA